MSVDSVHGAPPALELAAMADVLRSISGDLVASYERLAVRAARMEEELCETNAELEHKVRELDQTRERLEAILEALPSGVAVRDAGGRIVRVNGALGRILGHAPDELLGCRELPGLDDGAARPRQVHCADGEVRVLLTRRSEVAGAQGAGGSVEIVDDRTDLERLAERLHRVDKLAALGTMAGGLAHEIRNPMNAISGFAQLLLRAQRAAGTTNTKSSPPTEVERRRWLEAIAEGAREVESLIASLLSLAEPGRLKLETLAAQSFLDDTVQLALRGLEAPRRLEIHVDCAIESLVADRIQLRQALRNLVANAAQVQPDGGRIAISARAEDPDLVIDVEDAGPGIPAEHFHRLGDPFFTTRAEGTGLGLSLVHRIAELHGGLLEIERRRSSLGGAHLRVRIPLVPSDLLSDAAVGRPLVR